jgi:hypothetical protein
MKAKGTPTSQAMVVADRSQSYTTAATMRMKNNEQEADTVQTLRAQN